MPQTARDPQHVALGAAPPRRISRAEFDRVYERVILGSDFFEDPDYYRHFRERYWRTVGYIESCVGSDSARILDIGSGQFALLCRHLLAPKCDVADIDSRHTEVLRSNDVGFVQVDLTRPGLRVPEPYDLVVMAEVIEHVPRPPHLVFADLKGCLRPGGILLVTTPNLYRLRNRVRMALGQPIFDLFRYPEMDRPLGHFLEYSREQIEWHLREAGFEIRLARLDQLDYGGASARARIARRLLRPFLRIRPLWRDSLVFLAGRPGSGPRPPKE